MNTTDTAGTAREGMTMDEARLAEIDARANAATPGPWWPEHRGVMAEGVEIVDDCAVAGWDAYPENQAFIAAARTDVPALVAEVRRLTAALATVTAERDEVRAGMEEREHDMHLRIRAGYDRTIADSWRAEVVRAVAAERDVLRAEHAAALEIARREGAEAMQAKCRKTCRTIATMDTLSEVRPALYLEGRRRGAELCETMISEATLPGAEVSRG